MGAESSHVTSQHPNSAHPIVENVECFSGATGVSKLSGTSSERGPENLTTSSSSSSNISAHSIRSRSVDDASTSSGALGSEQQQQRRRLRNRQWQPPKWNTNDKRKKQQQQNEMGHLGALDPTTGTSAMSKLRNGHSSVQRAPARYGRGLALEVPPTSSDVPGWNVREGLVPNQRHPQPAVVTMVGEDDGMGVHMAGDAYMNQQDMLDMNPAPEAYGFDNNDIHMHGANVSTAPGTTPNPMRAPVANNNTDVSVETCRKLSKSRDGDWSVVVPGCGDAGCGGDLLVDGNVRGVGGGNAAVSGSKGNNTANGKHNGGRTNSVLRWDDKEVNLESSCRMQRAKMWRFADEPLPREMMDRPKGEKGIDDGMNAEQKPQQLGHEGAEHDAQRLMPLQHTGMTNSSASSLVVSSGHRSATGSMSVNLNGVRALTDRARAVVGDSGESASRSSSTWVSATSRGSSRSASLGTPRWLRDSGSNGVNNRSWKEEGTSRVVPPPRSGTKLQSFREQQQQQQKQQRFPCLPSMERQSSWFNRRSSSSSSRNVNRDPHEITAEFSASESSAAEWSMSDANAFARAGSTVSNTGSVDVSLDDIHDERRGDDGVSRPKKDSRRQRVAKGEGRRRERNGARRHNGTGKNANNNGLPSPLLGGGHARTQHDEGGARENSGSSTASLARYHSRLYGSGPGSSLEDSGSGATPQRSTRLKRQPSIELSSFIGGRRTRESNPPPGSGGTRHYKQRQHDKRDAPLQQHEVLGSFANLRLEHHSMEGPNTVEDFTTAGTPSRSSLRKEFRPLTCEQDRLKALLERYQAGLGAESEED
ncbi:hypothetical protein DQ04_13221000 [Trypanosoma grayi]|uniref:hypothetical protein n=1 Tax=Trypanosoma grayi TaxID=71804 RepID=UPI0004F4B2A1|nr:hypothetical protein DQ04_13221000 [Trypanosoma grayi]KEG06586.1 hypothetical protein DQ04_13221000 [Trypanosoma grayi]